MDRTERVGLGVALAGHVALFGLLSLGLLAAPDPKKLEEHPVEVSLVPDVGPEQTAPPAPTPPSRSAAPDQGAPEDAAPPPPAPAPSPPAPEPKPKPAPPKPAPNPEPSPEPKPVPPKPVAKPAPPAPAPKPVPKPAPKPKPVEPADEAPAKPAKAKPAAPVPKPSPAKAAKPSKPAAPAKPSAAPAKPAPTAATGEGEGKAPRARGSRLGSDFLKGLTDAPSHAPPSAAAPAARVGAQALAGIGSAIQRQIQPCANRQVTPGPGAERIRVAINLKLNRDGSLAAPPRVVNHDGVDDDNRRYLDRVDDLAIAAFTGCSPLTGLPEDLYDAPGGWRNFTLRYKLPG